MPGDPGGTTSTAAGRQRVPLDAAGPFLQRLEVEAGAGSWGLYLVGSPGLGDFSPRQSNLDLVAVTDRPLTPEALARLAPVHRSLALHGRDALVCYTTWGGLARRPQQAEAFTFVGRRPAPQEGLANPMTWAILARHPVTLAGAERPVVATDPDDVRQWFTHQLPVMVERAGALLWRRGLTRLVLQVTRAAHGARTGEVLSLHDAGEAALPEATHTGHRVLTDALGYRDGANTSMYWGPFERKSNALGLTQQLLRRSRAPHPAA